LILEDDAYPRNDIIEQLNNLNIKENFDILYLGHYQRKNVINNELIDDNFFKCKDIQQGSHAYIVNNIFYDRYIDLVYNDLYLMNHIDLLYKYTENSYLYKYRLFEQYTPLSIETQHIHYSGKYPGKFVSETLSYLIYESEFYTKIL
jgi:hypothetical protein